jgi:hypothetical protein
MMMVQNRNADQKGIASIGNKFSRQRLTIELQPVGFSRIGKNLTGWGEITATCEYFFS